MHGTIQNTCRMSIGSALEYYDFVIFAIFISFISRSFLPPNDIIFSELIFAFAYIARPIGGMIFGHIGDKAGRKIAITLSITFMGIATVSIGLLPPYHTIGITSTILLIILRIIQGISQGAELPGAITYISESVNNANRCLHNSILFCSISLGALLSTSLGYLIHHYYSQSTTVDWLWRIPFLFGGVIAILGYLIRKNSHETPAFLSCNIIHIPIKQLFLHYTKEIICGLIITVNVAILIILALFLPKYLNIYTNISYEKIYGIQSIAYFITSFLIPVFGILSDKIGAKKLYKIICATLCIGILILSFITVQINTGIELSIALLSYHTLIAALASTYPTILAESFPTNVRYSGISACYNLAYTIAAFTPFLVELFIDSYDYFSSFATIIFILSMIGFFISNHFNTRSYLIINAK